MTEYIERELALKTIRDNFCTYFPNVLDVVRRIPTADVQPVKHGHWYHNTSKYISELDAHFIQACCSCCGKYSDRVDSYSTIMSNETCSHCGAKMDGDVEGRCEE